MSELPGEVVLEKKERGDLDDPKKIGRKQALDNIQARRDQEDILFILSQIQGRRFYWKLMQKCGIFQTSFTGNNTTFFNEGMRNIGLLLLNELNEIAPQAYLQMIEEAKFNETQKR